MEQNANSINKVELLGLVGTSRVSEISGRKLIRLTLATNRLYKDVDGTPVIETTWHNVEGWESDTIPTDIVKGDRIRVLGRLRNRRYTDANGLERSIIDIAAETIVKDNAVPEGSVYVICNTALHHDSSYYNPVRAFTSLEKAKVELAHIAYEVKRNIDGGEDFGGEFKYGALRFENDGEIAIIETPEGYYERWEITKTPLGE